MINQIKHYLTKYNDANLWITKRAEFEEKKLAIETAVVAQTAPQLSFQETTSQEHVVFTNSDIGHNSEETSRIQQLYAEIQDVINFPKLAI